MEKLLHRDDTADVAALRVEQVQLGDARTRPPRMFANGEIDDVQLATITKPA